MPTITEEAAEDLRTRIRAVEAEAEPLRQALAILEGGRRAIVKTRARAPRAPQRQSGQRTLRKPLSRERLLSALKGHKDGVQAAALAKELKTGDQAVLRQLHNLQSEGLVTRQGERSQTRWQMSR